MNDVIREVIVDAIQLKDGSEVWGFQFENEWPVIVLAGGPTYWTDVRTGAYKGRGGCRIVGDDAERLLIEDLMANGAWRLDPALIA